MAIVTAALLAAVLSGSGMTSRPNPEDPVKSPRIKETAQPISMGGNSQLLEAASNTGSIGQAGTSTDGEGKPTDRVSAVSLQETNELPAADGLHGARSETMARGAGYAASDTLMTEHMKKQLVKLFQDDGGGSASSIHANMDADRKKLQFNKASDNVRESLQALAPLLYQANADGSTAVQAAQDLHDNGLHVIRSLEKSHADAKDQALHALKYGHENVFKLVSANSALHENKVYREQPGASAHALNVPAQSKEGTKAEAVDQDSVKKEDDSKVKDDEQQAKSVHTVKTPEGSLK